MSASGDLRAGCRNHFFGQEAAREILRFSGFRSRSPSSANPLVLPMTESPCLTDEQKNVRESGDFPDGFPIPPNALSLPGCELGEKSRGRPLI